MRMRTCLAAGAALLLALGINDAAPAVARAQRGLWRGLAEARVSAAEREGGQQTSQPAAPPPAKPAAQPPPQQPPPDQTQPPIFPAGTNYVRAASTTPAQNG